MSSEITTQQELFFGEGFLDDHAGSIIRESRVAVIELIANAYDAGATEVKIQWPSDAGGAFSIEDNGAGMTKAEFDVRWKTLSYNRHESQGRFADNPNRIGGEKRVAFGRSGKGRHGAFCFADSYEIATNKDGRLFRCRVERASGAGPSPFRFTFLDEQETDGHGTTISASIIRNFVPEGELREIIGTKFSVIPSFRILLNRQAIQLLDIKHLQTTPLSVEGVGEVTIHQIDSETRDRTTQLRGICWWVKRRAVGNPSWEGLEGEGAYLDGRGSLARSYSFVVEADILEQFRKPDWTGFYAGTEVNAVRQAVHRHIIQTLNHLQSANRKERKKLALEQTKGSLREMTTLSRQQVVQFIDEIQESCPTISERDLARAAAVFGKMESAKTGYDLLKQLQKCSPEDLDTWNDIMRRWSADSVAMVLHELEGRLRLIDRLKSLVNSKVADELHDLQPLFERGLWVFGPEYEGIQFLSNRGLATIIRKALGGTDEDVPTKRPDFVALPERSIGVYGAPEYSSENGEVSGVRKVLLVELKKGGFELTQKEVDQARDYAKELTKGGEVGPETKIIGYVLGATLELGLEPLTQGRIEIIPFAYNTFLERAHSRTFQLQRRIEQAGFQIPKDAVVDEVLAQDDMDLD
jgi:Histidine kinase-, DNA gyrase B-, and HSP90-like ATPase